MQVRALRLFGAAALITAHCLASGILTRPVLAATALFPSDTSHLYWQASQGGAVSVQQGSTPNFAQFFLHNDLVQPPKEAPTVHLRVPRDYISNNKVRSEHVWSILLLARYDNGSRSLLPADQTLLQCVGQCEERIMLKIGSRAGMGKYYQLENTVILGLYDDISKQDDFGIRFDSEVFTGETVMFRKSYLSDPKSIITEDLYVEYEHSGYIAFIARCRPFAVVNICEGYTTLPQSGGVSITYNFSANRLKSWRELQSAIHALVSGWIIGP